MEREGFEPPNPKERIYSPPRLASSLPFQKMWIPFRELTYINQQTVSKGIEPSISAVTRKRVNHYATKPNAIGRT